MHCIFNIQFCSKTHTVVTELMQFILSGILIFRLQHGSRYSCRILKYWVSTVLIPDRYHLYAMWRCTCFGSWVPCWCWQFSSTAGSGFKGQPFCPLPWLVQIKSASCHSLAIACYQWKLLELCPHRDTAGHYCKPSMLITACAVLSSFKTEGE